jgi:NAD-dependent deacetylase
MNSLEKFHQVAEWLQRSRGAVVFTGAGMSTESGIPDYRSPLGVWARYRPVGFEEFLSSHEARRGYWQQKSEAHRDLVRAAPNAGHLTIVAWEHAHLLRGVITQNIDGLHQVAGSGSVLELHGTARRVGCLTCAFRAEADSYVDAFLRAQEVPVCPRCGGLLKHATVSFGQQLPADVLAEATVWCQQTDLMLVLGSSLVVTPAADLPLVAQASGARLVIVNREPTPLDGIAEVVIHAQLGPTLSKIEDHRRRMAGVGGVGRCE